MHLTASHWPYFVSDTPYGTREEVPGRSPDVSSRSEGSRRDVWRVDLDARRKGALENAIVVVLSDHGEALELPGDTIIDEGARIGACAHPLASRISVMARACCRRCSIRYSLDSGVSAPARVSRPTGVIWRAERRWRT